MKHIFIINPAAGKEDSTTEIKREASKYTEFDVAFYETTGPMDATRYVKSVLDADKEEKYRFYACGGDGTLNEVVNGVIGYPNASVGCYPSGSGDDFVKYYGGRTKFLDFGKLLSAPEDTIDVLSVDTGNSEPLRYAANAVHFGFDTKVLKTMIKVKRKKIVGGKRAYITGVVVGLLKGMKNKVGITADGERVDTKGTILLSTLTNCSYVGGSFFAAPFADNTDGLIEVSSVRPLSRFTFVRLISSYKNGTHLEDPRFAKYITYRRAKEVSIHAPEGFSVSVDGELVSGTDIKVAVVPKALRFAVPEGCVCIAGRKGQTIGFETEDN